MDEVKDTPSGATTLRSDEQTNEVNTDVIEQTDEQYYDLLVSTGASTSEARFMVAQRNGTCPSDIIFVDPATGEERYYVSGSIT